MSSMLDRDPLPLFAALFVVLIVALAYAARSLELAVYALSFWHYLVYALAFLWRAIAHERFIRDSLMLKGLSLAPFVLVLSITIPNALSLIVMAIGFTFNIAAARALGKERTYYGYELAALPPKHITSFPYSLTAHPMLIGNMLAYGGTLLDETFRNAWWPLGVLHVILNLLIIVSEAYGSKSRPAGFVAAVGGLGIGAALLLATYADVWPYTLAVVITGALFGYVIVRRYA